MRASSIRCLQGLSWQPQDAKTLVSGICWMLLDVHDTDELGCSFGDTMGLTTRKRLCTPMKGSDTIAGEPHWDLDQQQQALICSNVLSHAVGIYSLTALSSSI